MSTPPPPINRRTALGLLIKGGVIGGMLDMAFQTPFAVMNNLLTEKVADPALDRRASRHAMADTFRSLVKPDGLKCSVGTELHDFHFESAPEAKDLRHFGQDDIQAARAILKAIDIESHLTQDPAALYISLNQAPCDLLALGGRYTNHDIATIFSHLKGSHLVFPEARCSVGMDYFFDKSAALRPIRRTLSGVPLSENHIALFGKDKPGVPLSSDLDPEGHPKNGYLLVSKFPHPKARGNVVIHVGGNTGPATEAANLLFTGDFVKKDEAELFNHVMKTSDACQAVFFCNGLRYDPSLQRHTFTEIELFRPPTRLNVTYS